MVTRRIHLAGKVLFEYAKRISTCIYFVGWMAAIAAIGPWGVTAAASPPTPASPPATATAPFTIGVSASPAAGGIACCNFTGVVGLANSLTLSATPNAGYRFVNWTENGVQVSASPGYTLTDNIAHVLVANFAPLTITPAATISANQTSFSANASDLLSLSASLQANDAAGTDADLYFSVTLSGFGVFYLGNNLIWGTTPAAIVSGFRLADVSAPGFYQIGIAGLPAGTYTFGLIFVRAGADPSSSSDTLTSASATIAIAETSLELSGSVVKGAVREATVTFFALNPDGTVGAQLGTTVTDASGNYFVTVIPAPTTPFLARSTGGTYVDEATGATTVLLATDALRAVLPAGTTTATLTPLTEIATARALTLAAGGTPLATAVAASNTAVAQQYNLNNIVTTLPVAPNDAARVAIAPLAERQYGLVLAGIAQNAATLGVRPIDLATALAADAEDGILNGSNAGAPILVRLIGGGTFALPAVAGTADIQTAINAFIVSANNRTGLTQMPINLTPVQLGVNTAASLYTTSTVLPAAVSTQTYTATVTATGGTPPYACALQAGSALPAGYALVPNTCQIAGTGAIFASGTTMTISPPFIIVLTDSASPPASVPITLYLTTVLPPPAITTFNLVIPADVFSSTPIAAAAGGVWPYYFYQDTFRNGFPPFGMVVMTNGNLQGTPAPSQLGPFVFGVCVADTIASINCAPVNVVIASFHTLTIAQVGTGAGTINASPSGASYADGTVVTLTATPASGSAFTGWSGACSGVGSCTITMDADQNVTATFNTSAASTATGSFTYTCSVAESFGGVPSYYSVTVRGTATGIAATAGTLGTYLMLGSTNSYWGDSYSCGSWQDSGYNSCQRASGQPEITSFTVKFTQGAIALATPETASYYGIYLDRPRYYFPGTISCP
ncbi:MAG: hypothetical protein WCV99_11750 [Sterolibacterium sp.]|jgi:hypothetical protein